MSGKNNLSTNQRKALAALLDNPIISKAAAACGLHERTLRRYLGIPTFRAELSKIEGTAMDELTRRLLQLSVKAADALESVLDKPDQEGAANKRLVAKTVIDSLLKIRELVSTEVRLSALEGVVYAKKK